MDFIDFLKNLQTRRPKIGQKLFTCTPEEISAQAEIMSRAEALISEEKRIDLEKRQVQIDGEKWWARVKASRRGSTTDNMHYEDGDVFELLHDD